MAKAKKTETAKTVAPKAKTSVKTKAAQSPAAPMIDTNLAAQNAARMLAAGMNRPAAQSSQPESAMFKQLKAGIAKPASLNPLLDTGTSHFTGKTGSGFKTNSQSASYHANVAKTGVPRRNPG